MPVRPEERLMIGGMARDDGRLARPVHSDNVYPTRVIHKQFGERLHVVSVPGFAVTFHYASNGFFRHRVSARSGSALGGSKRVTAIDYLARHFRVQRLMNRGGLLAADQAIGKQASDERDTSGDYRC